jgi:hypothetical protein
MALGPFLAWLADSIEADPSVATEASRLARALGFGAPVAGDERIPLSLVTEHGAPSIAWVQDRARRGLIEILGPRGGRFVRGADLRALLATTTIARRAKPDTKSNTSHDAHAAVVSLAARRTRRAG